MGWLQSMLYGFVTGLTEFLPVSSVAHQAVLARMMGVDHIPEVVTLMTWLGCLGGLLVCCRRELSRVHRDRQRSRTRHNGSGVPRGVLTARLVRTALIPMVIGFLLYGKAASLEGNLQVIALLLVANGAILFLPQLFPTGNKDARSISRLDGVLMGIGAGISVLPGISRVGSVISLASLRGVEKRYALNLGLLLSLPALGILLLYSVLALASAGAVTGAAVVSGLIALVMAFAGTACSIQAMRFLAVRIGFAGFCYYSWGAALFTFILFMTT